MILDALAPWASFIVYALTAVAAVAAIKVSVATQKDRLDEHLQTDRETHEKLFAAVGKLDVGMARLEEKVDYVRSDLKELRK